MKTFVVRDNEYKIPSRTVRTLPNTYIHPFKISIKKKISIYNSPLDRTSISSTLKMASESVTQESGSNVEHNFVGDYVEKFWNHVRNFIKRNEFKVYLLLRVLAAILYNCYFVAAVYHARINGLEIDWCGGVGMLIILTIITYCGLFYFKVFLPFWGDVTYSKIILPMSKSLNLCWKYR